MSPFRHAQAWLRRHPLAADALLALVVLVGSLYTPPDGAGARGGVSAGWPMLVVVASCAALTFRRSHPIAVWIATVLLAVVSILQANGPTPAVLPVMVAIYTLASWRSRRVAFSAALLTALVFGVTSWIAAGTTWVGTVAYGLLAWGALACAIGIAVSNQRAVVAAAEERARIAEHSREEEAQRRVAEERVRIARELHDVVAHHISVINVQAGVARHVIDTDPEAARASLGHIRDSSKIVLVEMRTILGLLRSGEDGAVTQPAPGLRQVDELVASMRRAGLDVTWTVTGEPAELAPGTELTAYRLVQESLTNARKHGTGTADVSIRNEHASVVIEVSNPTPPGAPSTPDEGHGLLGMQERVAASGGRLDVGQRADNRFVVHAELPAGGAS